MAKKKVKKKFKINKVRVVIFIIVLIVFIALLITLINRDNNPLVGKWITDKGTIYQFNSDYTGKLIISVGEYDYTYEIKDDRVLVDFENENSTDTEFSFKVEDETLVLKNNNGTFTFKKVK